MIVVYLTHIVDDTDIIIKNVIKFWVDYDANTYNFIVNDEHQVKLQKYDYLAWDVKFAGGKIDI